MTAGLGLHVTICLVHRLSQDAPSPSERDTILDGGRRFFLFFYLFYHTSMLHPVQRDICSVASALF